jgi:hypothetical protein
VQRAEREWIKGLATGILGLIGTFVPLAVGWLKERDISAKRSLQLDEAIKRVTFWEGWLKAIEPLDPGSEAGAWKEKARKQILNASNAVELLIHEEAPKGLENRRRTSYFGGKGCRGGGVGFYSTSHPG